MGLNRDYYYDISKKYLMLIGQWPYQKPKERLIFMTVFVILAITSLIPQVPLTILNIFFPFRRGKNQ